VAKARQERRAVVHDRRIGGEHEIRQAFLRRDELDCCTGLLERSVQRRPLPHGDSVLVGSPVRRVHPRIDRVADREVLWLAHQKPRLGHRSAVKDAILATGLRMNFL
jgi:hypothetical protein